MVRGSKRTVTPNAHLTAHSVGRRLLHGLVRVDPKEFVMSKVDELRTWEERALSEGLVHVNFYPGDRQNGDLELAATTALALLQGNALEEDVSDQEI
jgi:hypothetical protein